MPRTNADKRRIYDADGHYIADQKDLDFADESIRKIYKKLGRKYVPHEVEKLLMGYVNVVSMFVDWDIHVKMAYPGRIERPRDEKRKRVPLPDPPAQEATTK